MLSSLNCYLIAVQMPNLIRHL